MKKTAVLLVVVEASQDAAGPVLLHGDTCVSVRVWYTVSIFGYHHRGDCCFRYVVLPQLCPPLSFTNEDRILRLPGLTSGRVLSAFSRPLATSPDPRCLHPELV